MSCKAGMEILPSYSHKTFLKFSLYIAILINLISLHHKFIWATNFENFENKQIPVTKINLYFQKRKCKS